jgi:hypothetical protein
MKGDLAVYATLALAAGPFLFLRGFRDLRVRRLIQNTPTARIRSMAMGRVEVNGVALGRSAVAAPFSGRPCVYWQVEIAVRARNSWSTVHRATSGQPFFVQDDTGVAMVYPEGAECRANVTGEEACAGLALAPVYADYLAQRRIGMRFLWRVGTMRFRERAIVEGDPVFVLGEAQPRARSIEISEAGEALATGTDGPRRTTGERMRSLSQQAVAVIRRGRHGGPFLISQQSESHLCFDLGLRSFFSLVGGPAMTLFGLGYWLIALAPFIRGGSHP